MLASGDLGSASMQSAAPALRWGDVDLQLADFVAVVVAAEFEIQLSTGAALADEGIEAQASVFVIGEPGF